MKIQLLLIIAVILGFVYAPKAGANNRIDSLRTLLATAPDTQKITIFMELSDFFLENHPIKSLEFDKQGLIIAQKLNDNERETEFLIRIGKTYGSSGDHERALEYLEKAEAYAEKKQNKEMLGKIYNTMGIVHATMGLNDKALQYFEKNIMIQEERLDKKNMAAGYNNISNIYRMMGFFDKSLEFCNKALLLQEEMKDSLAWSSILYNMGIIYKDLNEKELAMLYFDRSLEMSFIMNDVGSIIKTYRNISEMHYRKKEYAQCLANLNKAEEYLDSYDNGEVKRDLYFDFSTLYSDMGDAVNGLKYHRLYDQMKDSLFMEDKNSKIDELKIFYDTEDKIRENEILKKDNAISKLEINKQQNITYFLVIISVIIIILLIVLVGRIRNNKRNAALLEKKGRQIEDINMKLQTLNNQLEVRVSERTVQLRDEIAGKEQTEIALKDALKQAENANKIKDTFLSNISHEIRTPMNAIIGLSDLLGKKLKGNDEYNKYIDGIIRSSNRLLNLFTNILDYSLLEVNDIKMDLTPCNTRAVVANAADLLSFSANEKGLDLIVRSDNAPAIMADSKSLTKVIADIIDNAVKYTEKGKIEVGADYNSQSNEVCINVSDTGIGIDQQYLPHIFETFSQEQQGYEKTFQGVGIGLPLAKKLIELMNGRIDISSRKGKGTTVRIYFNAAGNDGESRQSIPNDEAFISNEILKESGLQVLITEDDDFNALVLQEIIDRIGFPRRASNAEEAVSIIEEEHHQGRKFDLMIVDINLPGKMDGIELLKNIRNIYSEYGKVPFIAQTAYAMSRDRERLLMSGFDDYISKPIDGDELLAIVKSKLV